MLSIETPGRTAAMALGRLRERFEPKPAPPGSISAVGAKYDGKSWGVLLLRQGEELAWFDAVAARELADDLLRMADAIEGKVP